jgi:hypothetical protein
MEDQMRASILRSALLASAAALAMTSAALAAPPSKEPLPAPAPEVFPGGTGFCDFDVEVRFTLNREFGVVFNYLDGSQLIRVAGSVEITITNLESGTVSVWNAGGPGSIAFDSNGDITRFEGHGHVLVYGPLEPLQSSGIYEYIGKTDMLHGGHTGRRIDICAAIA